MLETNESDDKDDNENFSFHSGTEFIEQLENSFFKIEISAIEKGMEPKGNVV